jgi:hypothetical protein
MEWNEKEKERERVHERVHERDREKWEKRCEPTKWTDNFLRKEREQQDILLE